MANFECRPGGETIWKESFDAAGQGYFGLEVAVFPNEEYALRLFTPVEPFKAWAFPMRNAGGEDISVAKANITTMLWRMSGWFLDAFIDHINAKLANKVVDGSNGPVSLRYSLNVLPDNPFEDPEAHTPIAVIDQFSSSVVTYKELGKERQYLTEPVQEPWAAVFVHDSTCLSLLSEGEDKYHWMLDLLEEIAPVAESLFVDQADFLGELHRLFKPDPATFQFDFLEEWGLKA